MKLSTTACFELLYLQKRIDMCERFRNIIKQTVQLQLHKQVETSKSIGSSPTETQSVAMKLTLKLSYYKCVCREQPRKLPILCCQYVSLYWRATSSRSPGTINALLRHFSYWPICVSTIWRNNALARFKYIVTSFFVIYIFMCQ